VKLKLNYELILDEAPDAVFIVNNKLAVIDVNKCAAELTGYTKDELKSKTLDELFEKEQLQMLPFKIKEIENNKIVFLERNIKTKSGEIIPVEMKSKKMSDGNYFSIIRNISQRINARKELQESYEKIKQSEFNFRNLFHNIPLGIFIVNKAGEIEGINTSMAKILGSPSPEISKQYNIFKLATLQNTELLQDIKRCLEQGLTFDKVYQYHSVWGKEIFIRGHILPAEKNSNNRVLAIVEDYTEQKKKEFQLKILSEGVNRSSACVVVTDKEGEIIFVNQRFLSLTGYTFDEVKGKTPRVLKSGYHPPDFYENLWNTITSGNNWTGELLNKKKNGSLYWESTMIAPIKNEQGVITHYMAIKEDITEKKKFEEELKKAKEKAEESDRLKSSFLANMSHEIRTPLNAILGFTSLMRDYKLEPEKSTKFLDLIQTNSRQLMNIIDDVLLISKLQVKQVEYTNIKFLLNDFFQNLYKLFNLEINTINKNELNLKLDIPKENYLIETDKQKLEQILIKLIRNAIKFTNKGNINIGYYITDNKEAEFFVKDEGIGISREKQKIIFQRFRQVDDTKTRKYGGTGLGLSIAKGLVDLMQGKIWVQSEEGNGAHFYFSLPVPIEKMKTDTKSKNNKWNNKTILVVDDVPESILLIKELLSPTGINIVTASDGIEAIEKTSINPGIDVILMDIQLPRLNGMAAAKKILSDRNIPIIIQSAFMNEEYRVECTNIGCEDYIPKPFRASDLLQKIAKVL